MQPTPSTPRLRALALAALVTTLLALGGPVVAASASTPIEDFASYDPQSTCSPAAKPGTLALADWLQRTYPSTGSLGISRPCSDAGVSEHKEGRAFDWAADIASPADKAAVQSFLQRLFATDAAGNQDALARRMGIMYLIWNDHLYGSYRHFAARDYLDPSCSSRKTCSKTLRHRNHVHISLSRAGGAGRTSWYVGRVSPPVVDLSRTPYAAVTVPADGSVRYAPFSLRAGRTYQLTLAGVYGYGSPSQVADPSCLWAPRRAAWVPAPGPAFVTAHGRLDLRVNGAARTGSTCHPVTHVYTVSFTPKRTQALRLRVAVHDAATTGTLTAVVAKPGTDVTPALP